VVQLEEFVQEGVHLAYRRQHSATFAIGIADTGKQSQLTLDGVPIPRVLVVRVDHESILSPKLATLTR
jgi:hypothetical protein